MKKMMKKIRNPERWIGKRLPPNMEYEHLWRDYDRCDDCQCLWWVADNHNGNGQNGLHSFIYPQSEADQVLQKRLCVEEAMSYCPDCLNQIEVGADSIDLEWRERHGRLSYEREQ